MTHEDVISILTQFSKYGFRKTSMEDIARASGLSRQTVYNRFGSKEGAFEWTLQTFITQTYETARTELDREDASPADALLAAFQRWIGDYVGLLASHDHGMDVLDQATQMTDGTKKDVEDAFASSIADYLLSSGLAPSKQAAADQSFALALAGKGLMLKCKTSEDFSDGMARVIAAITN